MGTNNARILIVDDEPQFIRELQAALGGKPYQVTTVNTRTQAEIATRAEQPDIVILGTIAPQGEAFLLHQWLKQTPRFGTVPIIIIDARPEEQILKGWRPFEGLRCEANEFFSKPVNTSALVPLIEKLLVRETKPIRVLIADDHGMVRDGIRAVLSLQQDIEVVGDAVNGREALEKTVELTPDIVLMDIVMPVMNGLEATQEISHRCKQAKVIILTQYDDQENVTASRQVGAKGFIPKTAVSSLLIKGIRSVSEGKQFANCVAG